MYKNTKYKRGVIKNPTTPGRIYLFLVAVIKLETDLLFISEVIRNPYIE